MARRREATVDDLYRVAGALMRPFAKQEPTVSFGDGGPLFAVEVRSVEDYGLREERGMAVTRADSFAAGTLVVWDVDVRARIIRVFRASDPVTPAIHYRGDRADAEPALPGWSMAVDDVFTG